MKFLFLSSLATGPRLRVPTGRSGCESPLSYRRTLCSSVVAFVGPLGALNTAFTTLLLTLDLGIASLTLATFLSPEDKLRLCRPHLEAHVLLGARIIRNLEPGLLLGS
jgi:hypothetical protein